MCGWEVGGWELGRLLARAIPSSCWGLGEACVTNTTKRLIPRLVLAVWVRAAGLDDIAKPRREAASTCRVSHPVFLLDPTSNNAPQLRYRNSLPPPPAEHAPVLQHPHATHTPQRTATHGPHCGERERKDSLPRVAKNYPCRQNCCFHCPSFPTWRRAGGLVQGCHVWCKWWLGKSVTRSGSTASMGSG